MSEKYGFIYLWFDRKHKKYYVGRHWGAIDDGYICSSPNMRNNLKYRPSDFKRRIVSYVYTSKNDLVLEEQRWLDKIKKEELGVRYYNKTKSATTPSTLGFRHSEESKRKSSISNTGKKRSESTKEANRQASIKQFSDPEQRKKTSETVKKLWQDPEYRQRMLNKGKTYTEETLRIRAEKTGKRIMINNIVYLSAGDASRQLGKTKKWCVYHGELL